MVEVCVICDCVEMVVCVLLFCIESCWGLYYYCVDFLYCNDVEWFCYMWLCKDVVGVMCSEKWLVELYVVLFVDDECGVYV